MTDWESNSLGIVQEIEFWPYYQIVYARRRFCFEKETIKILLDYVLQTDYLIPARRLDS